MRVETIHNRRIQSIALILLLAILAVAGLLVLMGLMAAPEESAVADHQGAERQPVQIESGSKAVAPGPNDEDVVATVNNEVITKQAWQQAARLDIAMSRIAHRPIPTAEETLDRLVNEIIVLNGVQPGEAPTDAEIEARILTLATGWNVSEETINTALDEVGLSQTDLSDRVGRLIEVEATLRQLAEREKNVDDWLIKARTSAEVGLFRSLAAVDSTRDQVAASTEEIAAELAEPVARVQAGVESIDFGPPTGLPISPYPPNVAPDFTLAQLNQESLALSEFRGKPAIINFWATWCPPCRRELPALQSVYEAHSEEIGFIAVDVKEDAGTVAAFVEQLGLSFPVVIDADGAVSDGAYEVRGLPTTLFVDANGVVSARHVGPLDEALIDSYLAPLLESPPDLEEPVPQPQSGEPPPADVTRNTQDGSLTPAQADGIRLSTSTGAGSNQDNPTPVEAPGSNSMTSGGSGASEGEQNAAQPVAGLVTAPDFALNSADGSPVSLQDFREDSHVVLVFYRGHF